MAKRKAQVKERQRQKWQQERGKKKVIRHNTAANQEKHRSDWLPLQPDELGMVADRRIMPRDEQSRRHTVKELAAITLDASFDDSFWHELAAESSFALGVVVEVSRGLCRVIVDEHALVCDIRGSLIAEGTGFTNVVAVGDRVLVSPLEDGHGLVEEVLPRRSGLARPDPFYHHLKQLIAANVDQLLIVAAWRQPHIWLGLIDEYLIAAARNNLAAVICTNKVDLAEDEAECHSLVQPYADLGYRLLFTSAVTGEELTKLKEALKGKTTVLAGLSGVGKSSLLSAIEPGLALRAKTVSEKSGEGRHTTTQTNMWPLAAGGYVVDTPGIRELGLNGLRQDDLIDFYPEIADAAAVCRFRDCTHSHEPGCAVKRAISDGTIAVWRYENYLKMYGELPA
ncbi:MAG TPA: ribosome small subunit-dependent GTPase A [Anaerolineae bacterium]